MRHPGNAPGSPAWHTGILLLNQCRKKLVRADGYAPPLPVCKTGALRLRQARKNWCPRQDLHPHMIRVLDAAPLLVGPRGRWGQRQDCLPASSALQERRDCPPRWHVEKLDTPPGIAPGATALQAAQVTSSVRGVGGTNGTCTHPAAFTEPNANYYTMAPVLAVHAGNAPTPPA